MSKLLKTKNLNLKTNSGFTLIEVLTASLIIWASLFGILKLTNSTINQVNILENQKDKDYIFLSSKNCIKKLWFDNLSSFTWLSINFWADNNWCFTGTYTQDLNFSWVIINSVNKDNEKIETQYWNYIKINNSWWNYLDIDNIITDWKSDKEFSFKLYK